MVVGLARATVLRAATTTEVGGTLITGTLIAGAIPWVWDWVSALDWDWGAAAGVEIGVVV